MEDIQVKTFGNDLAFPAFDKYHSVSENGLSKREYFAAMAMQGLISKDWIRYSDRNEYNNLTRMAVDTADALIEQLNKQ